MTIIAPDPAVILAKLYAERYPDPERLAAEREPIRRPADDGDRAER